MSLSSLFILISNIMTTYLLNLLLDDCLLLLLVTTRHVSDLNLSNCTSVSGKLAGNYCACAIIS